MLTNGAITIYHAQDDKETRMDTYVREYFPEVSVQKDIQAVVLESGLRADDVIRVRIPTSDALQLSNGDRVVLGACDRDLPPENAHTVIGFADNRKGSRDVWHWKLVLR